MPDPRWKLQRFKRTIRQDPLHGGFNLDTRT
jgi:hypothetical protein